GVEVWKVVGSRSEILFEDSAHPVSYLHFSADSRWLALGRRDGAIRVYELATGRQLCRLKPGHIRERIGVALHPTEPVIAVFSYLDHRVQLRDLHTGEVKAQATHAKGIIDGAWSPDGRTLALGGGDDPRIFLYDIKLKPVR